LSKNDVVPTDGPGNNHLPKCTLTNSMVRVFGDTAVVMGDVQPENTTEQGFRVTTVFQKRDQGWQIIAIHMSAAQK
jgi:ketosteroid isomerase-like protein